MTRFAWANLAVQALKIEVTGDQTKHDSRRGKGRVLYKADGIDAKQSKVESASLAARPKTAKPRSALDFGTDSKRPGRFDSVIDVRDETGVSAEAPRIPTPVRSDAFDSGSIVPYRPTSSPVRRSNNNTDNGINGSSTIFTRSVSAPVTIILTPPMPDDELCMGEESLEQLPGRAGEKPSMALVSPTGVSPSTSIEPLFDTTRLMPPIDHRIDHQMDQRKLRKAQEFQRVRLWLIQFMNAKGDQFHKKLRNRMMEIYGIRECDLAPEIVAKFDSEMQDEGVSPNSNGQSKSLMGEQTDAEALRVLGAAFLSQIPEVTPRKNAKAVLPSSPQRNSKSGSNKKPETPKSINPTSSSPDLSRSPSLSGQTQSLRKSRSVPRLRTRYDSQTPPSRPPTLQRAATSFPNPTPSLRGGSMRVAEEGEGNYQVYEEHGADQPRIANQQTRMKRNNIVAGAFGAVREAMGGSRPAKAGRQRK